MNATLLESTLGLRPYWGPAASSDATGAGADGAGELHSDDHLKIFCRHDRHPVCDRCPQFLMHLAATGGHCVGFPAAGARGASRRIFGARGRWKIPPPTCYARADLPGGFFRGADGKLYRAARPGQEGAVLAVVAVQPNHRPAAEPRWWGVAASRPRGRWPQGDPLS